MGEQGERRSSNSKGGKKQDGEAECEGKQEEEGKRGKGREEEGSKNQEAWFRTNSMWYTPAPVIIVLPLIH